MGARGFAIAGGAVMAFGIGLFFVLATNRGWIDERARVALGASASGLVFAAGILLRARFGQYWAALAAVGAGIAGAYATLAAAAARYDLVPDALALPLAGLIAAGATVVAVRWRSQTIAALGLLGAALAPALQSLDTDLTWESAAFAVIVLLATGAVAVPCRWRELLIAMSVVVGLEVEWLLASVETVDTGSVVVASAFALAILGIAIGLQVMSGRKDVEPLALAYGLASFAVVLLASVQLFEDQTDRGIALLAAAAIWALAFAALQWRRLPDLALALGASALALAAVGTADLLVGGTLTVVWAAEAVALAFVSWRLRDARVRAMAIGYTALAALHAVATDAGLDLLFDDDADHLGAVLPLASVAAAAAACGLLTPASYAVRTEDGLLAFLKELRLGLERHARGIAEALCFAGAAFATLACSFALVSVSFEKGHMAGTTLAAVAGALALAFAAIRRSPNLVVASYAWLGIVLLEPFAFDVAGGYDGGSKSFWGGLSIVAASAGLLGGGYAHRLIDPVRAYADAIHGVVAGVAAASAAFALPFFLDTERAGGVGLLGLALVYGVLAAAIFPRQGFRDASTTLWAIGLVALVAAEGLLVTDDVLRTVVIAGTGLAVGSLYRLLGESRFWLAGGVVVVLTTLASLVVQVQPWLEEGELALRLSFASGVCALAAFGLAALVWREASARDLSTVLWSTGVLALLATERVLMDDLRWTAFVIVLTGAVLAALARPLSETRLWLAGLVVSGIATAAVVFGATPPSRLFEASESPGAGLWILAACIAALAVIAFTAEDARARAVLGAVAGGLAVYAASLGILEIAERVSSNSVETDFERGHTAVSALWALTGLGLLIVGLLRGSAPVRYAGLALFGLSLAKIFLYDLAELSSIARAFSFIFVGGLLLVGGFFLQRLSDRMGPRASEEGAA